MKDVKLVKKLDKALSERMKRLKKDKEFKRLSSAFNTVDQAKLKAMQQKVKKAKRASTGLQKRVDLLEQALSQLIC